MEKKPVNVYDLVFLSVLVTIDKYRLALQSKYHAPSLRK